MSQLAHLPPDIARRRVLGTKDAAAFIGLSVPTFRRMKDRKAVPAPILLSERRLGWRIGDLADWLDARSEGRDWGAVLAARAINDNGRSGT